MQSTFPQHITNHNRSLSSMKSLNSVCQEVESCDRMWAWPATVNHNNSYRQEGFTKVCVSLKGKVLSQKHTHNHFLASFNVCHVDSEKEFRLFVLSNLALPQLPHLTVPDAVVNMMKVEAEPAQCFLPFHWSRSEYLMTQVVAHKFQLLLGE